MIKKYFKTPNPDSAKERTMLHAIKTGKIQADEAKLKSLRKELEQIFGVDVDISIIEVGGMFDNPPFIPIKNNLEVYVVYDNLYCKVYLNSELETEELCQQINCMVSGRIEPIRTIITDWGEIDLRRNSDFNPKDFVFWQYYLDIEPKKKVDQSSYIVQIAKLLEQLNLENIKCVASCDFEEEL